MNYFVLELSKTQITNNIVNNYVINKQANNHQNYENFQKKYRKRLYRSTRNLIPIDIAPGNIG